MRNLKNISHSTLRVSSGPPLTAITWDAGNNTPICTLGPSEKDQHITLQRWATGKEGNVQRDSSSTGATSESLQTIASWEVPSPSPSIPVDKVVCLQYFTDDQTTCIVFAGGDIIIVREQPLPGEEDIVIVGSVDAGITAARWSPDEALLAISTEAATVLLMTRQFEVVGETIMSAEDLKASKHVSVGWGSAETQFKGKRAKALRDPTIPEKVDEGRLSPHDEGQVSISWRGDGAYVAVSSIELGKRRVIRVYDRECGLDSVSEPVDGLEAALSWRPAGNLIASIQRFEDHVDVVFFERNGLRHGQFNLRIGQEAMKTWATGITLDWSIDSTVLAVSFKDRVQLWTMGNYHYYLKQEIYVAEDKTPSESLLVSWNASRPLRLAVASSELVKDLEYIYITATAPAVPPNDLGIVAVIDGSILKLTPLRYANIPPPMAFHEFTLSSPALDVALSQNGKLVAVLHSDLLEVFMWDPRSNQGIQHESCGRARLADIIPDLSPQQVAVLHENNIFVLFRGQTESTVARFLVEQQDIKFVDYVYRSGSALLRLFPLSDHSTMCVEDWSGLVREVWSLDGMSVADISRFPEPAPWVEGVRLHGRPVTFGFSHSGSLYANQRLLAKSCTSFTITSAHLIFTTAQHLLKFVHLTSIDGLAVPLDAPENDERCRTIERGARIVSVVPTTFAVILQIPRGNLETVYPRALVVGRIRECIAAKNYKSAFYACRNQRVDMNILHDYAPKQFMSSVGLFIDQIGKVEHIDLFLSQLREEDVTQTMYRTTLPTNPSDPTDCYGHGTPAMRDVPASNSPQSSKVNDICDAFLVALGSRIPRHLQNVVTAHVSKSPPDLDAALHAIAKLRSESPELVESAVEHICFLADVNKLYDNALGLYDLDLALLVAQQSQKDPREYLPFLQSLQEMPTLRRSFTIDNHLGRLSKALHHLQGLDVFDEFKAFMVRHQLYKAALSLYRYDNERFEEVMALYAEHLMTQSQFRDAGIAYEFVKLYQRAMDAYRAAGYWREAISCARQVPLLANEVQELAIALADSLYEQKDYRHAAQLYLDYGSDIEKVARTLCKGFLFADALHLIVSRSDEALLESVLDQALAESMAEMTELLADFKGQLNAQVPRVKELRTKKEEDPMAYYEGEAQPDIPDNISLAATDTSTSASLFTRYTNRTAGSMHTQSSRNTSKNRRREERKRARGKKGTVYEEEYLVNSIRRLIERVNGVRDEVRRLVEGLVRRRMWERAVAVEKAMLEVVELCRKAVDEVFQPLRQLGKENGGVDGGGMPSHQQLLQQRDEGEAKLNEPPVVLPFEKLSLLDA